MATSIIRFHPFSGTNEDEPPCYLLQVDDFHCLLDCGWDSKFSDNYIIQLKKYIKIIDAVFISHPDIRHIGALPFLVGKYGLNCPIYTTSPVKQMGHLFLYDVFLSICNSEDFNRFNLDDIDAAMGLVVDMKYQQTTNLHGKGQGVTVTPYVAGHMIGGAIWKIVKDDLSIVYAIDYNHKKEKHLNGAMFSDISRPHLLITSSYHAQEKVKKKHMEGLLKQTLHTTLKKNGNILILSDTAGRSLELTYLLEKMWRNQDSGLMAYGLAFVNTVANNVIEFAKSSLEWLSDDLTRAFDTTGWKPFHLKYTSLCSSMNDIKHVPEPMVAIVSQSHLNYGMGRELFTKWCSNENNLIVVTSRDREQCLATELLKHAKHELGFPDVFNVTMKEESRLINEDVMTKLTRDYLCQQDKLIKSQSIQENAMELVDDSSSDEDDSVKMEWDYPSHVNTTLNKDPSLSQEDGMSTDGTGFRLPGFDIHAGQHSHSGGQWFRASKRLSLVFPSTERKIVWDTYGEIIDVKDPNFLNTAGSSYAMDVINQKLMWDDVNKMDPSSDPRKLYESSNEMSIMRDQLMSTHDPTRDSSAKQSSQKDVTVKCSILYQDYEGLADGAAMQQMISGCRPHEIIIVGGNRADSESMASLCRASGKIDGSLVHIGESGQVINCTKEGHIYQVRMSDALVSSLKFHEVGDYELAWLDAVVRMPAALAAATNNTTSTSGASTTVSAMDQDDDALTEVNEVPVLELPEGQVPVHSTIFINEPKLSELKQTLISGGYNAEITGGVLIVDGCVAIRKNEAGKLLMEGTYCETYFNVRKVLYAQFAIL